ncbi:MAG: ankyrin repeat domain-containing protein [Acidobacteriota bacterium]
MAAVVACSLSNIALCDPIHKAVEKGQDAKVVALLKQNPALISSRDKVGNTPLHVAALHNRVNIAELLLANGADVNAENYQKVEMRDHKWRRWGETPLSLALWSYHNKQMLELLLTHGADPNVVLSYGITPILRAVQRDLPDDVALLLANNANPNVDFSNSTPLHQAVLQDARPIVQILLANGADPNILDTAGHTPLYYAEYPPNTDPKYGGTMHVVDPKVIAMLRAAGGHD